MVSLYLGDPKDLLKRFAVDTPSGRYVRRVVLSVLNVIAENIRQCIDVDLQMCDYICQLCKEIFPFDAADDPQCHQWVEASLLPKFVEACDTKSLSEFLAFCSCEDEYTPVKHFICSAKQRNPMLAFLDDGLFVETSGMEIISETMRRRLSVAGVWGAGDSKKSFVVKPQDLDDKLAEIKEASSITPWQPRGVNVARQHSFERITRPW